MCYMMHYVTLYYTISYTVSYTIRLRSSKRRTSESGRRLRPYCPTHCGSDSQVFLEECEGTAKFLRPISVVDQKFCIIPNYLDYLNSIQTLGFQSIRS